MTKRFIGVTSMLRIVPLLALFLPFAVLSFAVPAQACECDEVGLDYAYKNASTIFVGRVDEQKPSALKPDFTEVKFVVFRKFKGFEELPNSQFVHLFTPKEQAACGYNFINGFEYLVFADGTPASLKVDHCSRTKLLEKAQLDQQRLIRMTAGK